MDLIVHSFCGKCYPEIETFFGLTSEVNEWEKREHQVQISAWYPCWSVLNPPLSFVCTTVGRLGRLILVSWVSWFLTGFGQWETLGRQWGREVEGELRIFLFAQLSLSVSGSNCISSKAPVPTSLPLLPWSPLLDELYYGSSPCWRAFASAFQQCQPSCCVHSCRGNSLCAVFILWVASSFHLAS